MSAVNNFHYSLYVTPQGKGQTSNSYSIINTAHRRVELKYQYEGGSVTAQVLSEGDVGHRKMKSVVVG